MNKSLTLGSLFDGSGTFPMMAILSGIVPVWKSEIEPFPIAVTEKRLPFVKHLDDINSINGAEIEPVDNYYFRLALHGSFSCRQASGFECRAFRTFLSGNQNHKGNERCNQWKISEIRSVGKRHRCFLLKWRRRLPMRPRRTLQNQKHQRFCP